MEHLSVNLKAKVIANYWDNWTFAILLENKFIGLIGVKGTLKEND